MRPPKSTAIAILPFKGFDSRNTPLGAALADAVITQFGRTTGVVVRPTQAVQRYGQRGQDPIEAGRQLRVDSVLDGTLQEFGSQLRLTVQLFRVSDGKQIWGQVFDHASGDLFGLEDALSAQVANALTVQLSGNRHGTTDREAHRLYLLGRHHTLKRTLAESRAAEPLLLSAILRDPLYAQAHAILANTYWNLAYWGGGPARELLTKAKTEALAAVRIDGMLPAGHAWLSYLQLALDHDFKASETSWKRALQLDPNDVDALDAKGFYCLVTGRFDESQEARAKLTDLNPADPFSYVARSWASYYSGRCFEDAVHWAEKAIELDPGFAMAHNDMYLIKRVMGRHAEAIESWANNRALTGMDSKTVADGKAVFDSKGIRGFDQWNLDRALERVASGQYVSPVALASLYNAIGDREKAIDYLEAAEEQKIIQALLIKTFPLWKNLHPHPRFQALLKKIGLH